MKFQRTSPLRPVLGASPRWVATIATAAATALMVPGCSSESATPLAVDVSRAECENLNALHCLMPWPSTRYLVADASTATGRRIEIPADAMPANQWGDKIAPDAWSQFDGFSPMTSAVTVFDGAIDTSNLPAENELPKSLEADAPTVLLDAETGERVGHFSEINQWEGTDPNRSAFYVRPAVRLKENHRYIVAIRGLLKTDGTPVQPSDYFVALRDDRETDAAELEARRPLFEDIFEKLEDAGVDRDTLIEAWDFHTATGESAYGDLLAMRDDAMTRVGANGLGCTVTEVEEDYGDENIFRRVRGTFTVPLYMETDQPGANLMRDASGKPAFNGTAEAPFELVIPYSVKELVETSSTGARLVTYGHGLMGRGREVRSSWQRGFWNRYPSVGVATNWWGMSEDDIANVANALGNLDRFTTVGERLTQGVINTLVLPRAIAGVCGDLPELQINGMKVMNDEKYYVGISQGSIMGTTVAALSQDIERFVLNVGGMSYPIMIIRSVDFPEYNKVIQAWYPEKLDTDLMMVAIASFWDLAEPATFASHVIKDPLPNTPAKRVLYTVGRYDAQVPNISSELAARTIGLPLLTPSVHEVWELPTTTAPADSAYVIYDVGAEPVPLGSIAAEEDNVAHGGVRRVPAGEMQWDAFMRPDGVVESFCDGACDPE